LARLDALVEQIGAWPLVLLRPPNPDSVGGSEHGPNGCRRGTVTPGNTFVA
jgi:hypothetical protein